jgi:hypothetical protein
VVVGALVSLAASVQMTIIVDVWGRLDVRRSVAAVYARQLLPAVGMGLVAMLTIYSLFVGTGLLALRFLVGSGVGPRRGARTPKDRIRHCFF